MKQDKLKFILPAIALITIGLLIGIFAPKYISVDIRGFKSETKVEPTITPSPSPTVSPSPEPTPSPKTQNTVDNTRLRKVCVDKVEAERINITEQVLAWMRDNPDQAQGVDLNQLDQMYKDKKEECYKIYK